MGEKKEREGLMFLDEIVRKRRSIRKFKEDELSQDQINLICQAALEAPSANNKKPVELLLIQNRQDIEKIASVKVNSPNFYANVPLCILVLVDKELAGLTYMQDASIAAAYIQAQVADMGLGSCWINLLGRKHPDGREASQVLREWFAIPEKYFINCVIPVGYPNEIPSPRKKEEIRKRIHLGAFKK